MKEGWTSSMAFGCKTVSIKCRGDMDNAGIGKYWHKEDCNVEIVSLKTYSSKNLEAKRSNCFWEAKQAYRGGGRNLAQRWVQGFFTWRLKLEMKGAGMSNKRNSKLWRNLAWRWTETAIRWRGTGTSLRCRRFDGTCLWRQVQYSCVTVGFHNVGIEQIMQGYIKRHLRAKEAWEFQGIWDEVQRSL